MEVGQMQRQWVDYMKSLFMEVWTKSLAFFWHGAFYFVFFFLLWSQISSIVVLCCVVLGSFSFVIIFFCCVCDLWVLCCLGIPWWSVSATEATSRWEQPRICCWSCFSLLWRFWEASQWSLQCSLTVTIHAFIC